MSGKLNSFSGGQGAVFEDIERLSEVAATADDLALVALVGMESITKRVLPLGIDNANVDPRLLAIGASGGRVRILPSQFFVTGTDADLYGAVPFLLSGKIAPTYVQSSQFAATTGSDRYDLLYATLTRAVTLSQGRRVKDELTAVVDTQTLDLEKTATLTLSIVPGVSSSTPLSSLPSDSGSAYNFGLAMVKLQDPYTLGDAIAQAKVTQLWSRAWIPQARVRGQEVMSLAGSSSFKATTPLSDRWGSRRTFAAAIKHVAMNDTFILDDTIDWRNRVVSVRMLLIPDVSTSGAANAAPELTAAAGAGFSGNSGSYIAGPLYTGSDNAVMTVGGDGAGTNTVDPSDRKADLSADSSGRLKIKFNSAPLSSTGSGPDFYWIEVDVSDRFVF